MAPVGKFVRGAGYVHQGGCWIRGDFEGVTSIHENERLSMKDPGTGEPINEFDPTNDDHYERGMGIGIRIWHVHSVDVQMQTVSLEFTLDFQWCDKEILEHPAVNKNDSNGSARQIYTSAELNALGKEMLRGKQARHSWPTFRFINGLDIDVDKPGVQKFAYVYGPKFNETNTKRIKFKIK